MSNGNRPLANSTDCTINKLNMLGRLYSEFEQV